MYKLLFALLILIGSFDYRISGLNYWDEALLFVVPAYYLLTSKKIFLKKEQINILASIILLTAIGLISNLIHPEFQPSLVAIAKDIIAFIKFPILASLLIIYLLSSVHLLFLGMLDKIYRIVILVHFAASI